MNEPTVNPKVYQPTDGHPYTPSPWPSLKNLCDLCAQPKYVHINQTTGRR